MTTVEMTDEEYEEYQEYKIRKRRKDVLEKIKARWPRREGGQNSVITWLGKLPIETLEEVEKVYNPIQDAPTNTDIDAEDFDEDPVQTAGEVQLQTWRTR